MATEASGGLENTDLFHQLDSYPWEEDREFQGGLRAILGSVQNPDQVQHLTLRAKCYYYAHKAGTAVEFDGYKRWVEGQRNGTGAPTSEAAPAAVGLDETSGGMADAPRPATFAEICDLIREGKPVPGVKDIPDTILEGQASTSQASTRKKPWEKGNAADETPSWLS